MPSKRLYPTGKDHPLSTHGMKNTPIYRRWKGIKTRCSNKKDKRYHRYGGRGISVCAEWANSFEAFYRDMGNPPFEGANIDRIDNNKGYSKDNCRWVTHTDNVRNGISAKLTVDDVSIIKTMLLYQNETQKQIGIKFGVTFAAIGYIKRKLNWEDISPLPV